MATRNISLTDRLDRFIQEQVESGDYQNASEVVRDAVRRLAAEKEAHRAQLKALLQEADESLARGDYVEMDVDDVSAFLEAVDTERKAEG